ncbi:hypothetical protein O6H91_08G054700 [Diphasiastrum complanatum]|uniref:Uncharacterized protein n=1 Tax=Diphasiastrum complanatum TaxID=34168 RepID=A0ACC2CXX0_DIPCM|nr:hypothetical protein O6H91_08G054700 [Diphasiastrum complanatum]
MCILEMQSRWLGWNRGLSSLALTMLQPRLIAVHLLIAVSFCTVWVEPTVNGSTDVVNPSPTERGEAMAMRHLRYTLQIRSFYWPRGTDPCALWRGVECQDGHVTGIQLTGLKKTPLGMSYSNFALDFLQKLPFLRLLNASGFSLPREIPDWFGSSLSKLEVLDLTACSLNGSIPATLGELSSLQILALARNQLTGSIPATFGKLSNLRNLNLSGNDLGGQLPAFLSNATNLSSLDLSYNSFVGPIPVDLGKLSKLEQLFLAHNSLSGSLPAAFGDLSSVHTLDLSSNNLSGPFPLTLGRMGNLTILNLARNNFNGSLLQQWPHWSKLQQLILNGNSLSGELPDALGSLTNLVILNLASNKFSGILPTHLSELMNVQNMILSHNFFYGPLPDSLVKLKHLSVLDLSSNFFNGSLPSVLPPEPMWDENCLSSVPKQRPFQACHTFYAARGLIFGGHGSQFSPISQHFVREAKSNHLGAILGGVFGGLGLVLLTAVFVLIFLKCEIKSNSLKKRTSAPNGQTTASTADIAVNTSQLGEAFLLSQLQNATQGFSPVNIVKTGHSGDLYRGLLDGGVQVVVKRIEVVKRNKDLFIAELNFFGKASHTRLVPLLGHCFEMEEEKFFVYKGMPHGDLAQALHKKVAPGPPGKILQSLDWITRLKIAIGVAEGLSYLHHECSPPLVHRDIKASSILLDDKYEVRLGSLSEAQAQDGGSQPGLIARLLRISQTSEQSDPDSPVASCPYDVYCFGKVLLELVSGKLGISDPVDPAADSWVDSALALIDRHNRESMNKLVDPSLVVDEDLLEEVWAMAIIAKLCLNPKPAKRPLMRHILKALENPQRVVREENFSAALRSRNSSRGSWNASLFGSWRKSSSDTVVAPGTLKEEYSLEMNNRKQIGTSHSQGSMRLDYSLHKRPGSNEIFPEPFEDNQQKPSSLVSDEEVG